MTDKYDIFSVIEAPAGVFIAVLDEDEQINHVPIKLMAFAKIIRNGSQVWVPGHSTSLDIVLYATDYRPVTSWTRDLEHENKKNGECRCGWNRCKTLGIWEESDDLQKLHVAAEQRRTSLRKVEERRLKARDYQRRRKEKTEAIS